MKAAIDIDGTLTARPDVLSPLTAALTAAGWDVVLLTGHAGDQDATDAAALLNWRIKQTAKFEATYRDIVIVVGWNAQEVAQKKGDYLRRNDVNLFIDNDPGYCAEAKRRSPGTLTLHVH